MRAAGLAVRQRGRTRFGGAMRAASLLLALLTTGCISTISGGPDRLYSVAEEGALARGLLEGSASIRGLVTQYYTVDPVSSSSDRERMLLRNEIVARRMYIIDVEYSEYEANLTSERQKFGFLTTTAAAGLGIASTLTTPLRSAQILAGAGAGVLAARGAYDTEVVIAKTLQIVQGHMRAQRDDVYTKQIFPRLNESAVTYPLSAAMRDTEDYYRAGTFTSGLIPALRESGAAAEVAADVKSRTVRGVFGPDSATDALETFLTRSNGKLNRERRACLNRCLNEFPGLRSPGGPRITLSAHLNDNSARSVRIRQHALQCAQQDPECSTIP